MKHETNLAPVLPLPLPLAREALSLEEAPSADEEVAAPGLLRALFRT